jgi:hypothetical protein
MKRKVGKEDVFSGFLLAILGYFIGNAQDPVIIGKTAYLVIRYTLLLIAIYMILWFRKGAS